MSGPSLPRTVYTYVVQYTVIYIVWARGAACARGRNDFADKTAAVYPSWPYIVVGVPVFTIITITTVRDDIHATNKQQQIVV